MIFTKLGGIFWVN